MSGRSFGERAFIGLQYLLPQHAAVAARRLDRGKPHRFPAQRADPRVPAPLSGRPRRSCATGSGGLLELQRLLHAPPQGRRTAARRGRARRALPGGRHAEPGGRDRGRYAPAGQGHRLFGRGPARRRLAPRGRVRGRRVRDNLPRAAQLPPRPHAARRDAAARALRARATSSASMRRPPRASRGSSRATSASSASSTRRQARWPSSSSARCSSAA